MKGVGIGCEVQNSESRVEAFEFKVQDSGSGVWGLWFKVEGLPQ